MKFLKGKLATTLVVIATIILAGVAIYTAVRLYNLRNEGVALNAPDSSKAWDCSKYTFLVSTTGVVTVKNESTRDEPSQQAKVYINNALVSTLNVPALLAGGSATLGNVQVPSGGFSWRVEGTRDCRNSGSAAQACQLLTFTITVNSPTLTPTLPPGITATLTPTPIPSATLTPTAAITPTEPPVGGISPTLTPTPGPTNSPTPTLPPGVTATPTPTLPPGVTATVTPTHSPTNTPTPGGQVAATSPSPAGGATLPNAGSGMITVLTFGFGIALITFALLIAI